MPPLPFDPMTEFLEIPMKSISRLLDLVLIHAIWWTGVPVHGLPEPQERPPRGRRLARLRLRFA